MKPVKNSHSLKRLLGFGLIVDLIILDQASKWIILEYILKPKINMPSLGLDKWITATDRLPHISLELSSYFNLTMVWNKGISFGLFQSGSPWPLIFISLAISGIFGFWLTRTKSWVEAVSLSMVIGGALGNVLDRLHFGAVADFLDFYIADWHYPAFNLADSFITVGIVILVMNSLFLSRENERGSLT